MAIPKGAGETRVVPGKGTRVVLGDGGGGSVVPGGGVGEGGAIVVTATQDPFCKV